MNGKDVLKKLQSEGWIILRREGSHVRLGKVNARTTVPVHGNRDIKVGTLANIERQT